MTNMLKQICRGAYNIQPQKLVASQYIDNDDTQRTDTRHRHKSSSRKLSNEGSHGNRNRATKQSLSHSPQISMTFCPEKCNCGFKNNTNQLEVICSKYLISLLKTLIISIKETSINIALHMSGYLQWILWRQ